jgi:hypothetical protein
VDEEDEEDKRGGSRAGAGAIHEANVGSEALGDHSEEGDPGREARDHLDCRAFF